MKQSDNALSHENNIVLFETCRSESGWGGSMLFRNPETIITAYSLEEVVPALRLAEAHQKKGNYVAGYVTYEAGFGLDEYWRHVKLEISRGPLVWFGVYGRPEAAGVDTYPVSGQTNCAIQDARFDVSRQEFGRAIDKIKRYISSGDTYQINYTMRCNFGFSGGPFELYSQLRRRQRVSYTAFIRHEGRAVISLSPELFFTQAGPSIVVKPMKGTAGRGKTAEEDKELAARLLNSEKERAENIMIVDLLRSDLGRICEQGSVEVSRLCEIEKFETLHQMTSTICGRVKKKTDLAGLFRAIFPSGSVTGAPKLRSMEIIKELEKSPRGIYTGAIGYLAPRNRAVFNVAIRTVVLEGACGQMGIGSGIVWDSDVQSEYEECLLKARFLNDDSSWAAREFRLIESILWQRGRYKRLHAHLTRLKESACYFGFRYNYKDIMAALGRCRLSLDASCQYKIRLLLDRNGGVKLTHEQIDASLPDAQRLIAIAEEQTDSGNVFLYHKTTERQLYDEAFCKGRQRGLFDVIFTNERGEITEGCITNIFIKKEGQLFTPPVASGLLAGVYRQHVIKKYKAVEKVLTPGDLAGADEIYLTNAIRGMVKVKLA